jgi:hypothetical protein
MPITVAWGSPEKTILLESFEGSWGIEDFKRMVDEANALVRAQPHPVHVILDATHSATPPTALLTGMRYAIDSIPANQDLIVFVKVTRVMRMFIDIAQQIAPKLAGKLYFVDTVPEALELIGKKTQSDAREG